ncbi:MAG TPA: hypothetical protein VFP12_04200 [Allosphingosinicella sp.]|nr:hypothetical protein [Allosphingosinicella sp.]
MPFFNSYAFDRPNRFNRALPVTGGKAGRFLAVGGWDGSGTAAMIEADGSCAWARRYHGLTFDFVDVVQVGSAGFLLLSAPPGDRDYVLVRIDAGGSVLWSRSIPGVGFGPGARVLRPRAGTDEFLVVAWAAPEGENYHRVGAVLFRLAADGSLLRAVELVGAGRVFDAAATDDGYILVGDQDPRTFTEFANAFPGLEYLRSVPLIVQIDTGLTTAQRWTLGRPEPDIGPIPFFGPLPDFHASLRAVTAGPGRSLFVAGSVTGSGIPTSTVVFQFDSDWSAPALRGTAAYALLGNHRPHRIAWSPPVSGGEAAAGDLELYVMDVVTDQISDTSSVARLDKHLAIQAFHRFAWPGEHQAGDLQVAANGVVGLAATLTHATAQGIEGPPLQSSAELATFISVGWQFQTCRSMEPGKSPAWATNFNLAVEPQGLVKIETATLPAAISSEPTPVRPYWWCGKPKPRFELQANALLQSPYLNLQAAGSDGSDASRGILLRWFLAGALGDTHLPKGSLAGTTTNFNKPDDFVRLHRAPWPAAMPVRSLSFVSDRPRYVDDGERLLVFETGAAKPGDLFHVRFLDSAAYAAARQTSDPATNPSAFLAAYGARPVEVELRDRLAIGCDLDFAPNPGCSVKVETRSVGENRPLAQKQTSSRRILGPADGPATRLYAENMRSLRVQCAGTAIRTVSFLCYEDLLAVLSRNQAWSAVGHFALTDDDATALTRLEDPGRFQVNGLWRKFNDGAFVNVKNYQNRWSDAQAGLRAAVKTYVQLSETDPVAEAKLAGASPQDGEMKVSYLDLLQLAATDFHIARMLGLGHVDWEAALPGGPPLTWVHLAEYLTLGDLGDGAGPRPVQHLYLSLPTNSGEPRLPITPLLDRVDYGLTVTTASGEPYWLTDAGGYTPDGLSRFIRLYPDCPPLFEQEKGFFDPPNLFDLSRESLPVFYGVEHRLQGEPGWRRPEIAHDPVYLDTATPPRPESRPVPFGATRTAKPFPHEQKEAGVHEYAVYGVNLFSRASPTSPAFASAATTFVKANRLLPPSDLQVQFIQPESPLVLTSADEQKMLDDLLKAGKDPTLVRICFNYGFPQEANYEFAHAVEIFHRRLLPANVTGGIVAVVPATDPRFVRIETRAFTYASTGETIQPTLPPAAKANFIGGVLAVGSRRLIIEDISWPPGSSSHNPIFLVRRPTTTGAVGKGSLVIEDAPLSVNPGDLFMAVENMAAAASWGPGNPLGRVIALGDDPSWKTRTESFTRPDQTLVSRHLRGIWESATLAEDPAGSKHYTLTFAGYALAPHPQSAAADPVNWFRGVVRVPVTGRDPEDRRMLKVIGIGQNGGKLELRAVDDSGESGAIATGPGHLVHYLPGYRVHLHADPASGFDRTTLMPASGEGSRTTLLGVRSVDPTTLDTAAKPYRSPVGVPQLLTAMEIIEPGIPLRPRGLKYATPPDSYGKASYTLNVEFEAAPFAVAFYRADALAVLEALYEPEQQVEIRAAIFPAQADPYFASRFDDLFAFLASDDSTTELAVFPLALGDNYFLPLPNAASLGLAGLATLAERKQRMKAALLEAFVALTEQPLIYELISTDPAFVPTNAKQVFRNAAGEILAPGQAGFDLAPMAKRPGGHEVQFTDFTLEGSMNRDTVYFYLARELGNRMQLGEPSPIFGPVLLVNLAAPAAPQLRKIGSTLYDDESTLGPEVRFDLLPPSATDPMARLVVYRTSSARDALSVRTMLLVQEIDVATLTSAPDGSLTAVDDFRNEPFIPFGEPLYYRLAWVREVDYEDAAGIAHTASAESEPTATLLANLVDVVNPPAPVPAVAIVSTDSSTGDKLIELSWTKTTHNGTYYVCQLSASGNWFRLAALKTNSAQPSFALPTALPSADEDGDPIYYRFKVDVENSSGLLNLLDAPITVNLAGVQ